MSSRDVCAQCFFVIVAFHGCDGSSASCFAGWLAGFLICTQRRLVHTR